MFLVHWPHCTLLSIVSSYQILVTAKCSRGKPKLVYVHIFGYIPDTKLREMKIDVI